MDTPVLFRSKRIRVVVLCVRLTEDRRWEAQKRQQEPSRWILHSTPPGKRTLRSAGTLWQGYTPASSIPFYAKSTLVEQPIDARSGGQHEPIHNCGTLSSMALPQSVRLKRLTGAPGFGYSFIESDVITSG
jgi:hypothetical protein